jgi:hypothetical protein
MDINFDQTNKLARDFIRCYLAARNGLEKLDILHSGRNVQGDYAEWLVENILSVKRESNRNKKGIDATDQSGQTYQIKSRIVKTLDANTSFDFATIDSPFDFLICVFFSPEFEPLGIFRVPYEVVHELGIKNQRRFCFRWNARTSKDTRIKRLFEQK